MSTTSNLRLALDWIDTRWLTLVRWLKVRLNFRLKLARLLQLEGCLRVG